MRCNGREKLGTNEPTSMDFSERGPLNVNGYIVKFVFEWDAFNPPNQAEACFDSKHDRVVPRFTSAVSALRRRFSIEAIVPGPDAEPCASELNREASAVQSPGIGILLPAGSVRVSS
jgi:hypothetical protein